ncbi:hypothetical protein PHJA_001162100 [Phtheirospermum japonicum]|uniref:Uncharacterized protein n=1 Tax=Phtheirospermum japonicum TaxID=374723 RepID=A0A830BW19_9LAMI|nr:hypothetical protein PHJA_001162100 [Phtheirospermum japonicum]
MVNQESFTRQQMKKSKEKEVILRGILAKKELSDDVDVDAIAYMTDGFSGSDLKLFTSLPFLSTPNLAAPSTQLLLETPGSTSCALREDVILFAEVEGSERYCFVSYVLFGCVCGVVCDASDSGGGCDGMSFFRRLPAQTDSLLISSTSIAHIGMVYIVIWKSDLHGHFKENDGLANPDRARASELENVPAKRTNVPGMKQYREGVQSLFWGRGRLLCLVLLPSCLMVMGEQYYYSCALGEAACRWDPSLESAVQTAFMNQALDRYKDMIRRFKYESDYKSPECVSGCLDNWLHTGAYPRLLLSPKRFIGIGTARRWDPAPVVLAIVEDLARPISILFLWYDSAIGIVTRKHLEPYHERLLSSMISDITHKIVVVHVLAP